MFNLDDEKLLLHQECSRLLKRPSKKNMINDVMNKLFYVNNYYENYENKSWYEIILMICGCSNNI